MSAIPSLFLNNLLPILLIAALGYALGQWLEVDPKSVSRMVFYVLSPFLVFDLLANSQLSNGDIARMMSFAVVQALLIGAATWVIGRALRLERQLFAAVMLTTILVNAGNYGLSLNAFAFGEEALAHASLFFITSALVTYTAGVTIASLGSASLKESLARLAGIPAIYAAALGGLFNAFNWPIPFPLERTVSLLSDATIPAMLIVLGLQVQRGQRSWEFKALAFATGMRLVGGALIALLTAGLLGLRGAALNAGVIEAATPTAVMTTILATEFDARPAFVTSVVFITTLLSPLTLTPLLAYLGA